MARSTPTYTPRRNYAIAFFLSAFILFADINYQTFASLRGITHASNLYIQIFSRSIIENISFTFSSFKQNKNLLLENKKLRDQILETETKDFKQSLKKSIKNISSPSCEKFLEFLINL